MKTTQIGIIFLLLTVSIIFKGCAKNEFLVNPATTIESCPNIKLSVTLIRGTTYMGTFTVPYRGEKPISFKTGSTIESIGVKGLSATLKTNYLASGNGVLIYIISGSPDTTGNAVFLVNFNKHSCEVVLPILE